MRVEVQELYVAGIFYNSGRVFECHLSSTSCIISFGLASAFRALSPGQVQCGCRGLLLLSGTFILHSRNTLEKSYCLDSRTR